jgi:hypothetical protein
MTPRRPHRFQQLDMFASHALQGDPLAVVHDASSMSDETLVVLKALPAKLGVIGPLPAGHDTIWIGGEVAACVDGQVVLP